MHYLQKRYQPWVYFRTLFSLRLSPGWEIYSRPIKKKAVIVLKKKKGVKVRNRNINLPAANISNI